MADNMPPMQSPPPHVLFLLALADGVTASVAKLASIGMVTAIDGTLFVARRLLDFCATPPGIHIAPSSIDEGSMQCHRAAIAGRDAINAVFDQRIVVPHAGLKLVPRS